MDRCPRVEAATARGGHRRRACLTARRVQGGRRATNTRAAATIARGGSKGRRKPPRRAHRATSARRARRRRAGRGARNGRRLRRCPRRRRECRGSRGGRNRPRAKPRVQRESQQQRARNTSHHTQIRCSRGAAARNVYVDGRWPLRGGERALARGGFLGNLQCTHKHLFPRRVGSRFATRGTVVASEHVD
jgi:hypothetical protein